MLKKWIAEALACIFLISSTSALDGSENRFSRPGNQVVQEIDSAYQEGEYDSFLRQMHEHFQNAGRAGALRGIFESAKVAMSDRLNDVIAGLKAHRTEIARLNKERDQKLLEAIAGNPEEEIVQKVDSVVFSSPTLDQDDILKELEALKFEIPETALATIENKISALETEYYIKSLLLDIGAQQAKTPPTDTDKKKTILQLEKLDKMEEAAKDFNDPIWINKIEKAKAAFRAEKAFRMDYKVLENLGKGIIPVQNPVEEKVKEIMMEYLQQREQTLSHVANN